MDSTNPSPNQKAKTAKAGRRRGFWPLAAALAALVSILGGAVAWKFLGSTSVRGAAGEEMTYTVVRGPLTISFNERGTIKAAKSEQVFIKLEGMSTIVQVVQEGTSVKKGDLLVELDSSELTQLLNQQSITVDTASAALTTANEQVEIQKSLNESELHSARLAVDLAKIDLEKYEKGDYPLASSKAANDINIAEEELTRSKEKYTWTKKLADKGYLTETERIADEIALHKAEIQSKQALKSRDVLEAYTKKKDSMKAISDLEQAQRALERAERKTRSTLAQAVADQRAKESTYNLSVRRLNKIKDQLDKTKILAPQDGMVVYFQEGHWGREDRMIEQGATVRENQHLIDLPDLSVMAASVQVPEARIHQVKEGLTATVTIEAQTELVLRGTITKIGLLPDYVNRWLNPDLKVYTTIITVDPDQDTKLLRPGMSAKVEILVDKLEDALYVPIQSVTTKDGQQVCFVLQGGEFQPQVVEVGQSNNSFIQVISGLNEGDVIQLNAPKPQGVPAKEKKEKEMKMGPDEIANGNGEGYPVPASFNEKAGRRVQRPRKAPGQELGFEGGEKADGGGVAADALKEGGRKDMKAFKRRKKDLPDDSAKEEGVGEDGSKKEEKAADTLNEPAIGSGPSPSPAPERSSLPPPPRGGRPFKGSGPPR